MALSDDEPIVAPLRESLAIIRSCDAPPMQFYRSCEVWWPFIDQITWFACPENQRLLADFWQLFCETVHSSGVSYSKTMFHRLEIHFENGEPVAASYGAQADNWRVPPTIHRRIDFPSGDYVQKMQTLLRRIRREVTEGSALRFSELQDDYFWKTPGQFSTVHRAAPASSSSLSTSDIHRIFTPERVLHYR